MPIGVELVQATKEPEVGGHPRDDLMRRRYDTFGRFTLPLVLPTLPFQSDFAFILHLAAA